MEKIIRQKDTIHEEVVKESMTNTMEKNEDYYSSISEISLYLKEIEKYPVLTPEEERELAIQIINGNNLAKEKFINSNLRLVVFIAKKYCRAKMDLLDLIQEGNWFLLRAVEMFDYTKGFKFSTYAAKAIERGIKRAIYNQANPIRISASIQGLINKYQWFQDEFYKRNMRYATDLEISKEMEISVDKVNEIKAAIYKTVSLNEPITFDADSELGEFIQDTDLTPEEIVLNNSRREFLERLIDNANLSIREKLIIRMRFDFENNKFNSLESIAKKMGISKERVRALEGRALKKLRVAVSKYGKEIFM